MKGSRCHYTPNDKKKKKRAKRSDSSEASARKIEKDVYKKPVIDTGERERVEREWAQRSGVA